MDVRLYGVKSVPPKASLVKELGGESPEGTRKKELAEAGFAAIAQQMEPEVDQWASIRPYAAPVKYKDAAVYRRWFGSRRVGIDTYDGPLPEELPQLVIAINEVKCFKRLKVWVAKSGEALLVGKLAAEPGREPQLFVIAQWNPNPAGSCTDFKVMQQSYKRFWRLVWASSVTAVAVTTTIFVTLAVRLGDEHHETSTQHSSGPGAVTLLPFLVLFAAMFTMNRNKRNAITAASSSTAEATGNSATPEDATLAGDSAEPGSVTGYATPRPVDDIPSAPVRSRADSTVRKDGEP